MAGVCRCVGAVGMTATAALRRLCSGVGAAPLEAALGSLPDTFTQLPVCDSAPEGSVPFCQGTPVCHCPAVAESPESPRGQRGAHWRAVGPAGLFRPPPCREPMTSAGSERLLTELRGQSAALKNCSRVPQSHSDKQTNQGRSARLAAICQAIKGD